MRTILYMLCLLALTGCQPQPTVVEYIPANCERSPQAWMEGLHAPDAQGTTAPTPKALKPQPKLTIKKEEENKEENKEDTKPEAIKPAALAQTPEKLDLNQASAAQLEQLPGIGPALAARIVEYRQRRPFRSVSQLRYVKGIGPNKYGALHTLVTTQQSSQANAAR